MRSVTRIVRSRWMITFIGAAVLAALVWLAGQLLDALAGRMPRAVLVVCVFVIWAAANIYLDHHRRRTDKALADGVAKLGDPAVEGAEEVAALREKLVSALAILRRAAGTRGYLYEQPWYMIIGPPGAGKTTALLNAGLKFPLAAEMGQGAVAGVGGTRLCDWWFTDHAVLIDTAGRYTTQDSHTEMDRAGWEGFLDLLRRTRPRLPINGVFVAIAASDLAQCAPAERLMHARAVRKRVKELISRLSIRLPIYVLFTKMDLITGFVEFFDELDAQQRGQVWGETFDLENTAGEVQDFTRMLKGLLQRLNDRLIVHLQAERSAERRVAIAGFPAQFLSLETPLTEFLVEAFGGSRLDPAPLLRGVYFTSGTQEGTPIARLTAVLSRTFGVDQKRAAILRPEKGRSYFLAGPLRVALGEALLASAGGARRRGLRRAAAFGGIALVTAGLGAALANSWYQQMAEINRVQGAIAAYAKAATDARLDVPIDAGSGTDLMAIMPLLDQARRLPHGAGEPAQSGLLALGLSQDGSLRPFAQGVYRQALQNVLLPRLVLRQEHLLNARLLMKDQVSDQAFLYQALRIYLMLGGRHHADVSSVLAWEKGDCYATYQDDVLCGDLILHVKALLAESRQDLLDEGLIDEVRAALKKMTQADRIYETIAASEAAQSLPEWRLLNEATGVYFRSSDGRPLGIPGFFTKAGFHDVLLAGYLTHAAEVMRDDWVLNRDDEPGSGAAGLAGLKPDVIRLYEAEYERHWDRLLANLSLVPIPPDRAGFVLQTLSSPGGPLKQVLARIAEQLHLSKAATDAGSAPKLPDIEGNADKAIDRFLGPSASAGPLGHEVDDYYNGRLLDYVGGGGLDLTLSALSDVAKQIASGAPNASAALGLKQAAAGAPPSIARILTTVAQRATAISDQNERNVIRQAFHGSGGPGEFCANAVNGVYPFISGTNKDSPLGDFGRVFGYGGLFDAFFKTNLQNFVDDTTHPWVLKSANDVSPPLDAADLRAFELANDIREDFFDTGGAQPSVSFSVARESLDDDDHQATLYLGGMKLTVDHGLPPEPVNVVWPGESPTARLTVVGKDGRGETLFKEAGPWAIFRLIDHGQLTGGPEAFTLTFKQGQHEASFDLTMRSSHNPFASKRWKQFSCPRMQ